MLTHKAVLASNTAAGRPPRNPEPGTRNPERWTLHEYLALKKQRRPGTLQLGYAQGLERWAVSCERGTPVNPEP
jgi:hypothetical protein